MFPTPEGLPEAGEQLEEVRHPRGGVSVPAGGMGGGWGRHFAPLSSFRTHHGGNPELLGRVEPEG